MDKPLLASFAAIAFPLFLLAVLLAGSLEPRPTAPHFGLSVAASVNQTFYS
ncbi:MAG TPA: hypothetical protein VKP60_13880 [Magnetospirillaceae bacterium]|nr:hypothetical protein [Magnetospirillaceae bacterium]